MAALGVAFLFCVVLAGTALAGMFSSEPSPGTYEAQIAPNISFTVHNNDSAENITSINITFPAGIEFVPGSDYTNASNTQIYNTSYFFIWNTSSSNSIMNISESRYFNLSFHNMTAPGNYNFELNVTFTDNSYGNETHNITITDTTSPIDIIPASGETPDNGSWNNVTGAWINFTFTEINPEGCNLSLNNGTGSGTFVMDMYTSPNKCSFQPSYSEGYWNYTISVNDTSDNMETNETYYFGYDYTYPNASSLGIYLPNGTNISGSGTEMLTNINITANLTDSHSGFNTSQTNAVYANVTDSSDVSVAVVNLEYVSGDAIAGYLFRGTWNQSIDNTGPGTYSINVTATDLAENTIEDVIVSTMDIIPAPDLIVSNVTWISDNADPGWPTKDNMITLNITVRNVGNSNTGGSFNVNTSVDGSLRNSTNLAAIDQGNEYSFDLNLTSGNFSTNKWYVFTVTADPENNVSERSEINNTYTLGLSLGYNISLVKIHNGTTEYFPPNVTQTFPTTNITVNVSVTYANGTGMTGLGKSNFQFFNKWSSSNVNMSDRIYSFTGLAGGYYTFVYDTLGLYEDSGGNKTRPRFGDNYLNLTALSGSYSGEANITYNITAPDLNVYIDIDDVDLQGDTNGYWIDFNLSITNTGNAPAYGILVDDPNDWVYDNSVFYDLDADGDLSLGVLQPGENHNFPDGARDLMIDAIGTSSGSDMVLWVFVHYNDSDDNEYQGFDYDKTDIDNSGTGDVGDDDTTTGGDTGGSLTLEVTLTDWDDVIQGYPGESNTTRVKVKNTGDVTVVAKVRFTCEVMQGTPTIAPISKSVAVNSDQEFIIDFNINSDAEIGEYDCEVEAYVSSSEDDYDKETIVLKILATEEMAAEIEGEFENISLEVEELLDRFSRVNPSMVNDTNMSRVYGLMNSTNDTLNEIHEAIENGDYLTAHSLIESLQASLISTTQSLEDLELEQTMGGGVALSGTWFWAVIIIVVVIAVAFVAYLMFPQKSYGPKKSIFGTLADTIKGGPSKAGSFKDSGKSKISSLSSKKPFRPSSYAGGLSKKKPAGYSYGQGPGAKIKGAISKLKEKLKRKKKPQKEVTQYFVNSSSNIINYS